MHSIIRDDRGRLVPVVQPKGWQAASVKRSRDRTDRIARARKQRKAWLATTQWMNELDRRGIAELEATGIAWRSVERWLDALDPREVFAARMVVKQVLQMLADDQGATGGTVRGQARAVQAADRRRHCRLRTYAAVRGPFIAVPAISSPAPLLQRPPNRRFTALVLARQLCHCLAGSVTLRDAPALAVIECSRPAELLPFAFARWMPSSHRLRIRPRSNSAIPPMMVSINLPTSLVLSHQFSPSETKPQPRSCTHAEYYVGPGWIAPSRPAYYHDLSPGPAPASAWLNSGRSLVDLPDAFSL